jgi:hypothetical protein
MKVTCQTECSTAEAAYQKDLLKFCGSRTADTGTMRQQRLSQQLSLQSRVIITLLWHDSPQSFDSTQYLLPPALLAHTLSWCTGVY